MGRSPRGSVFDPERYLAREDFRPARLFVLAETVLRAAFQPQLTSPLTAPVSPPPKRATAYPAAAGTGCVRLGDPRVPGGSSVVNQSRADGRFRLGIGADAGVRPPSNTEMGTVSFVRVMAPRSQSCSFRRKRAQ